MTIRSLTKVATQLLGILALGGCASPPSTFYTLRSTLPTAGHTVSPSEQGLAIGIGPVRFPEFLDRPQIVSRAGTNRLALDEFHRWGGSLDDDFLRVLGENLGQLLGTSRILVEPAEARFPVDFRVVADVLSFEGVPGGDAVLKIRWGILNPYMDEALVVRESSYRSRAASADQEAMIAALSKTLASFSRDVAEQLRRLPKTKPLPARSEAL